MTSAHALKASILSAFAAIALPSLFLLYSVQQINLLGWDNGTATGWGAVFAITIFIFTYTVVGFYFFGQLLSDAITFKSWKFRIYNIVGLVVFAFIAMSLLSVYTFISQKNFDLSLLLRGWGISFIGMSILCVPSAELWLFLNKKFNSK